MNDAVEADIGELCATELARGYRSGELSPVEATKAALDRIERFDSAVNAFVHVDAEGALKAAEASARRWGQGQALGDLDGVPVSIKDLTEVRGMPAREGSATTSSAVCEADSPPAARLREAGAVILGKTNTPEFGWKAVTDNPLFGVTRNPWDTGLTPGGSSGGAAAAAALNMGVLHQGGDSGGSIRVPAAFTGTFGFKPTFGLVPQWPPSKMSTLSQIGPITRTVADAVLMLEVMGNYDHRDPYATRAQPDAWGGALQEGLSGMRVAYSPDFEYADVGGDIAGRVKQAVDVLADAGAEVEQVDGIIEDPVEIFRRLWFIASQALEAQMTEAQREQMDPGLRACARRGEPYRGIDLFQAQTDRAELILSLERLFQRYDLLVTPAVPIAPFEAGCVVPPDSGMEDWMEWTPFSYPFNLSEQPAASVPCGFTAQGLPVGMQIAGGKFDDNKVLRACHAYLERVPPRFPRLGGTGAGR